MTPSHQHTESHTSRSPARHAIVRVLRVIAPPLVAHTHGHYHGRPHHLLLDTLLAAGMLALLGWNVTLLLQRASASPLTVQLTVPEQLTSGTAARMIVTVENTTTAPVEDATLDLTLPEGATVLNATPAAATATTWKIGTLEAKGRWTLALETRTLATNYGKRVVRAVAQGVQEDADFVATALGRYIVTTDAMVLSLVPPSDPPSSGAPFTLRMTLQNTKNETLQNVRVVVSYPTGFSFASASVPPSVGTSEWAFSTLEPFAQREIALTGTASVTTRSTLRFTAQAFFVEREQPILQNIAVADVPLAPSATTEDLLTNSGETDDVQFVAEAHYFSTAGVQFGYGPLPPRVGKKTGYRIFWTVKTSGDVATNGNVTATLPSNVSWAGNAAVTLGQFVRYDVGTNTVRWPIGDFPSDATAFTASFDVVLEPTSAQKGTPPTLINPSTLTWNDKTDFKHTRTSAALTTAIQDAAAADKHRVTK